MSGEALNRATLAWSLPLKGVSPMHTIVSGRAAHLTVTVLLVLLVGGCAGQDANQAATPQSATSTAAPTTTTVPPLTADEVAWLKALPKLDAKISKAMKGRLDLTIEDALARRRLS
jgi:hypothetical protein